MLVALLPLIFAGCIPCELYTPMSLYVSLRHIICSYFAANKLNNHLYDGEIISLFTRLILNYN